MLQTREKDGLDRCVEMYRLIDIIMLLLLLQDIHRPRRSTPTAIPTAKYLEATARSSTERRNAMHFQVCYHPIPFKLIHSTGSSGAAHVRGKKHQRVHAILSAGDCNYNYSVMIQGKNARLVKKTLHEHGIG